MLAGRFGSDLPSRATPVGAGRHAQHQVGALRRQSAVRSASQTCSTFCGLLRFGLSRSVWRTLAMSSQTVAV